MLIHKDLGNIEILKNILNGMDAYIYVTDPKNDEILFINDKMRLHFGLGEGGVGQTCWKVLQAGFSARCDFCPNHTLLKNPEAEVVWEEHNTVTGRHYKNTDKLIQWGDGRMVHLQHSVDITDLKNVESSLKKQLEQMQIVSAIAGGFTSTRDYKEVILDALQRVGEFMDVGHVFVAKYDQKEKSLVCTQEWFVAEGQSIMGRENAWRIAADMDYVQKMQRQGYVAVEDFTVLAHPDYEPIRRRNIGAFLNVAIEASGRLWGTLGIMVYQKPHRWTDSDIAFGKLIAGIFSGALSRYQAEETLFSAQRMLSTVLEHAPMAIFWKGLDLSYKGYNQFFSNFFGHSANLVGKNDFDIMTEEDARRSAEQDRQVIETGETLTLDELVQNAEGEKRWIHLKKSLVYDNKNQPMCIVGVSEDITEQKNIELELIEAKEMAEQGSRAKGEFLSRMSHEIRTPMNAIIGMTSIAQNAKDPEKKEYCLDKIKDASKHLLGVINDILDMSKIEANKFELSAEQFNLEKMLMNVTNVVSFRAEEKRQNLLVQMDSAIPAEVVGDEMRLNQVVTNLLSNAVKFTPEGGTIKLNVRKIMETPEHCELLFEVVDNGIGISLEQQSRLFRSFEQADGGIARKYGGTGLGLVISKQIVELLGGKIWVESQEGEGAKFSFTANLQKIGNQPTLKADVRIGREDIRILAVDDSFETREYFLHIMKELELHCDVAKDGYEALEMIEKNRGAPYTLFFIDWQMPGMNGIELTRRIKELAAKNSVIIMISVSEWSDIETQAISAGVSRFIPKPLFVSALVDTINECIAAKGGDKRLARKKESDAGETPNFGGKAVLLAEDIEVNREIIQAFLEDVGICLEFAANGKEAVSMFERGQDRYQLIFMDVHMPEMDGFEATRAIRALPTQSAKKVPIVAMTANVFKEDIDRCISAGMNDHIGKPVERDKLLKKLVYFLQNNEGGEGGGSPSAGGGAQPLDYETLKPYVDVADGLPRLMNNKKLYFTLLKNFKGQDMVNDLLQKIAQQDHVQIMQVAHAIKGASANLGLMALRAVSADIEARAKQEAACDDLLEKLKETAAETTGAVTRLLTSEGAL